MPQIKQIKTPDLRSEIFYKDIVSIFKNNKKNSLPLFSLSGRQLIFITHQTHYKRRKLHHTSVFSRVGSKIETPIKFSKSGGLTGCQFAEGGCWEEAGYFFQGGGGCSLYIKNKLKY